MKNKEKITEILEALYNLMDVTMDGCCRCEFDVKKFQGTQTDAEYLEKLQSTLSMVHTLIIEGRINQLNDAIHFHFPDYFSTPTPIMFSNN